MKRNIQIFLTAMLIIFGFSSAVPSADGDYANQKVGTELSASDWQAVIKANYGFDLTLPSGWSFSKGNKNNVNPSYQMDFTTTTDKFMAAYNEIHRYFFDLTAKVTPSDGNFNMDSASLKKGEPITALKKQPFTDEIVPTLWYFNTSKGAVQLALVYSEKNKFVRVSLIFMGQAK